MTKLRTYTLLLIYLSVFPQMYFIKAGSLTKESRLDKLVEKGVLISRVNKAAELNICCIQARSLIRKSSCQQVLFHLTKMTKLLIEHIVNCSVFDDSR